MKNFMNSIKLTRPGRNLFDLSHDVKMSLDMGGLYPTCVIECVPGDKFKIGCESLLRFQALVSPAMHRMDSRMEYFFVPNRLVYPDWEKFISPNLYGSSPLELPYFNVGHSTNPILVKSRADYMGVPLSPSSGSVVVKLNALPFAAINKIFNDYYRDQNLVSERPYLLTSGDNSASFNDFNDIPFSAWEHDYFTSSLPFAQAGPAIDLPLGDVFLKDPTDRAGAVPNFKDTSGSVSAAGNVAQTGLGSLTTGANDDIAYDPDGTLEVGSTTINALRTAFRLQEFLEKAARAGRRYVESILAHFGVRSPDARLQRAEYIVGTSSPVVISEVLNTTGTDELPQGNMAGHGLSVTTGKYGSYFCQEHGFIIGFMRVRPKTAYMQGLPRYLSADARATPYDYFWPEFAHLGEQPVMNQEIYAYTINDLDTFGYMPRFAEYRTMASRVAGEMRTTLDFWHLARSFDSLPPLNEDFINCVPSKRIFAVEDPGTQSLIAHVLHKITASRLIPKYGTPTF